MWMVVVWVYQIELGLMAYSLWGFYAIRIIKRLSISSWRNITCFTVARLLLQILRMWCRLIRRSFSLKALFGLIEWDRMKRHIVIVVWNRVPLFGFFKNEWNGVIYDDIHYISFCHFLLFFFPSICGVWDEIRDGSV
jgi:hypothetical protein